ncbi:MAG: peptidylprolyl isomerase, partial [Zoogloeaceae bacterium]|nr:peptidylprolyl isomerase [Zoogloeaceae bacterium]
ESFLKQVKLTPDAVNAYYDANTAKFQVPEQLRAEYLVLSHDRMTDQVSISEDEIKAWYAKHPYRQAEERQASHILILVGAKAADEEVNAAQAKADEVLALAKKSPKDFAKLAKQHSQDSGSATQGGDLGWFGRGAMVKSFEDAVFSMKEGQVSDLVRSDFGFHIIKLTGIHAERSRPLDEVRNEIVATLKAQAAEKKYIEAAEGFTNTVYEQSDSLAPAAEKYKLTIQTSDWLRKGAGAAGPLGNAKLMAALFSDDAIKEKRNTEAVQIAPKVLVSARVLEYKPATQQPLEMVAPTITAFLTHQEAAKLAAAEGEQKLDQLNNGGKVSVAWSKPRGMKKGMAGELPVQELNAIFRADAEKLPAYAGVSSPNGYTLLRITKVKRFAADGADTPQAGVLRNEYTKQIAGEELAAWLAVLREKYPVKINRTMLESKDQ